MLSEWCATLDAEGLGQLASAGDDDSEEEWGGIAGAEDVEMGEDEEDDQEEVDNAEGIIRKTRDDDEDAMDAEEDEAEPKLVLSDASLSLFADLPLRLLALAQPTSMSFIPAAPDTATTSISAAAPSTLLPSAPGAVPTPTTSTATLADVPEPLHGILDILTTVHVRAIECLNNVYITLARSAPGTATGKEGVLQKVWEGVMGLVQGASETGKSAEEDEKKMEVVMAGTGVAWGVARVGLGSSSSGGGEDESDDGAETAPKLVRTLLTERFFPLEADRSRPRRSSALQRHRSSSHSSLIRSPWLLLLQEKPFEFVSPVAWDGSVVVKGFSPLRTP